MRRYSKWKHFLVNSRVFKTDFSGFLLKHRINRFGHRSVMRRILLGDFRRFKTLHTKALFERQRLKSFYGISKEKEFRKIVLLTNFNNFFSIIESRLDILLWRSGFFKNLKVIRQLISHGFVFVNNTIEKDFRRFLIPNEEISLSSFIVKKYVLSWMNRTSKESCSPRFFFCSYAEFSPSLGRIIFFRRPQREELFFPFKATSNYLNVLYRRV